MNVLTIIQIALFVPFFLLLTIFAIVYLINGYKKDLGRSILSLAATIVAIGISLLLAKLLGWALSPAIISLLPAGLTESLSEFGALATDFIQGAIEIALSFLLFGLFFIISLAVLKGVGKKIHWDKLENLNTGKKGTRLGGMGLRAIDAVLVSIMLLLPLYGTIATVAPPAATLMQLSESMTSSGQSDHSAVNPLGSDRVQAPKVQSTGVSFSAAVVPLSAGIASPNRQPDNSPDPSHPGEISISDILEAVANHPVLTPYKYGPGAWVYSELSSFSMNGKTVEVSTVANSLDGMLDRLQTFRTAIESRDEQAALNAIQELITFTRNEVINQRWSYNMVMAFVGEIDTLMEQIATELDGEDKLMEMYERVRPLLDMSFEEYTNNAEGLLDFAGWLIETYGKYGEGAFTDDDEANVKKELYLRLGNLLNHSKQATALKQIVLQMYAQTIFDVLPNAKDPNYADYYAGRKDLPNSGTAFVNKYFGDGIVPEKDRLAEASAFFSLLRTHNALDTAEVFVRYPLFGADAVLDTMDEYLYIRGGTGQLGMQLSASDKAAEAYEALDRMLRAYENVPYDQPLTFSDAVHDYIIEELGLSNIQSGTITALIKMGADGKVYLIPEELMEKLAGLSILDEQTIQKYGLKPYEGIGEGSTIIMRPQFGFASK